MISVKSSIPGSEHRTVTVNPEYISSIRENETLGGSVISMANGETILCQEGQAEIIELIYGPAPEIISCDGAE